MMQSSAGAIYWECGKVSARDIDDGDAQITRDTDEKVRIAQFTLSKRSWTENNIDLASRLTPKSFATKLVNLKTEQLKESLS